MEYRNFRFTEMIVQQTDSPVLTHGKRITHVTSLGEGGGEKRGEGGGEEEEREEREGEEGGEVILRYYSMVILLIITASINLTCLPTRHMTSFVRCS